MRRERLLIGLCGALAGVPVLAYASRPVVRGAPPPDAPEDAGAEVASPTATGSATHPVVPAGGGTAPPPSAPAVPKEISAELAAKPIAPKKGENPADTRYQQRVGDFYFRLHVRPGSPRPGDALELVLEVAEVRDPPDPVLGDRVPVQNEELVATFGKGGVLREMHPLSTAGEFGLHVEAEQAGVAPLSVHRRSDKPGLDVTFPIGVGVPTPARPDDVLASVEAKPVPMAVEPADSSGNAADLDSLMRQLGRADLALALALDRPKGDADAAAQAIANLSAHLAGLVPKAHANRTQEFDQVAAASASLAVDLTRTTDHDKLRARLGALQQNGCLRCHAQFWYGIADDTSAWPSFTPGPGGKP